MDYRFMTLHIVMHVDTNKNLNPRFFIGKLFQQVSIVTIFV